MVPAMSSMWCARRPDSSSMKPWPGSWWPAPGSPTRMRRKPSISTGSSWPARWRGGTRSRELRTTGIMKTMNKKQLTQLEKRLLEERARVMKELGYYDESFNASLQSSDGDLSSYSFHMADQGTDAMEREKQFLFASQEGRYLWHVNEALRRLYGTPDKFGHCHQCGQEINFERLDALPHARLCITCKEKEEDGKRR